MKKIALGILSAAVITVLATGAVLALPSNKGIEKAKTVSPAISAEGEVVAPPAFVLELPESELTKIVFIRFAPGKEPVCDNNGICEQKESWKTCPDCTKGGGEPPLEEPTVTCYGFLAGSKPKWNWIENYYYSSGLGSVSAAAVSTWKGATSGDIFGNGLPGTYQWGVYDYINSVTYDDYDDTGMCPTSDPCVLGVTAIWFRGKNIYEYDIMLDIDFFPNSGFDLPTVTLHEFGHAAGLDDLYNETCNGNVMYGYLGEGEVKTILGSGDVEGIQILYGF